MKTKLTLLVVFIVLIGTYTLGRLALRGLGRLLENGLGLRAESVVHVYVDEVDPAWLNEFDSSTGPDQEIKRLESKFNKLVDQRYITRVELVKFVDTLRIQHLLSVPVDNSPDYQPFGKEQEVPVGDLYAQRGQGHNGVDLPSGPAMAGWRPIVHNGEVLGLLIVYIDAYDTQHALNTAIIAVLVTMIVVTLLSGIVSYKFSASIEKIAVTDGLMGIYNHKYFKQRLEDEVARAARYGQQTSIVLLDIDFFKRVNDTYGHATGDLVLKTLARIVTDTCRNTDVVARYGGEEVACILPHTGMAGAQEFAERLRIKISEHVIRDPEEDAEFRVTVSVGVAQWEKGLKMLDLIKRADAALYHSKETGRNRVTIYQDQILPDAKTGS